MTSLHLRVPPELVAAIDLAAARSMTSRSEVVRQAVLGRLRADGIDPTDAAPGEQLQRRVA